MAKIRKYKLSWKPSDSPQVVGYRLYWSKSDTVSYDSKFVELGDVSEVCLPDVLEGVPLYDEPILLGITAMDEKGNESDIATLVEPYQPMAPLGPVDLLLTILDEFNVAEQDKGAPDQSEVLPGKDNHQDELEELAPKKPPLLGFAPIESKVKYYDDVGFRKPIKGK